MNFSESGWNEIGHLWRWGRWRKKRIRRIRWYKFGADAILSLKKSRNLLARNDASGDSGSEFERFR